eukprot:14303817-Heterocapsa_arctica.AAC.1
MASMVFQHVSRQGAARCGLGDRGVARRLALRGDALEALPSDPDGSTARLAEERMFLAAVLEFAIA